MIDPNVPSYFLIILCGFGVVWSFRYFSHSQDNKIYEFEYVAFSTLWGSLIFLPILLWIGKFAKLLELISQYPFIATPSLFFLGVFVGYLAVKFITAFKIIRRLFSKRLRPKIDDR